jgi:hypothetical protein
MVASVAMLAASRDTNTFDWWPEMKRAVVIATATWRMNLPILAHLGGIADQHAGAGMVDAYKAATLGNPSLYHGPGGYPTPAGRYAKTYTFASDFDWLGRSTDRYFMSGYCGTNSRMRVVIAWDATGACSGAGACTGSTLDADLDLVIHDQNTGAVVCDSSSYDSSWEMCDFAVDCSTTYMAEIDKFATNASNTYLGIAWLAYTQNQWGCHAVALSILALRVALTQRPYPSRTRGALMARIARRVIVAVGSAFAQEIARRMVVAARVPHVARRMEEGA